MVLPRKTLKWTGIILSSAFVILVIVRAFHFYSLDKTNAQIEKIHATKLQLSDVMGENLPPDPGELADVTVEGVDANENGIRDDVELAIFEEYPDSAKTRAVLLQYALALQMQFIQPVVNSETVIATVENKSKANACMWNLDNIEKHKNFLEQLQINTIQRNEYLDHFYKKLGSYTASRKGCDLDLLML